MKKKIKKSIKDNKQNKTSKKANGSISREEFIKLQNEWYKKLSDLNFVDLEWLDKKSGNGQNSPFLRTSLNKFKHLEASDAHSRMKYFTDASAFTHIHKFPTTLHKRIWELFANGISYRRMIPILEREKFSYVPSIFWISIKLNELKKDFWAWQLEAEEDEETMDDFIRSNTGVQGL